MRTFSADDITTLTRNWTPLVDACDAAMIALADGTCEAPLRTSLPLTSGQLLVMPGRLHEPDTTIVKLVSIVSENATRDLATINGLAILFDSGSGVPLATFDGGMLTTVRTAAISASAARKLADPDSSTVAMLGSGSQAPWQARALADLFPLKRMTVWSPRPASRERLARALDAELDCAVESVASVEVAVREASIVVCATSAAEPFLHMEMLATRPVTVIAIGAYTPQMAEAHPSIFAAAGEVYVDDLVAALHEGGDVLLALREGAIPESAVLPLGRLLGGHHPASTGNVSIFKSVGSAVEDAAVAHALLNPVG